MKHLAIIVFIASGLARAQGVCPNDPAPRPANLRCLSGKDPVSYGSQASYDVATDFTVRTGVGQFEFKRYYSSSSATPKPTTSSGLNWPSLGLGMFGMGTLTPEAGDAPLWSHSLFSFVHLGSSALHIYDGSMSWTEHSLSKLSVGNPACYVFAKTSISPSETERLENTTCGSGTAGPYRRIRDDGEQWIYGLSNGGSRWYLSEVRHANGSRSSPLATPRPLAVSRPTSFTRSSAW